MSKSNEQKEHPIIFSAPMVRAILAGRKTQTRRVINRLAGFGKITEFGPSDTRGYDWHFRDKRMLWNDILTPRLMECCPLGKPGNRLWVRETWAPVVVAGAGCIVAYRADGEKPNADTARTVTLATPRAWDQANRYLHSGKWAPSIFMPRWACRTVRELVSVRVERLQDISEADARAEGIYSTTIQGSPPLPVLTRWVAPGVLMTNINGEHDTEAPAHNSARAAFEALWDSINAKRGLGWDTNPWVWVYEFKPIEATK